MPCSTLLSQLLLWQRKCSNPLPNMKPCVYSAQISTQKEPCLQSPTKGQSIFSSNGPVPYLKCESGTDLSGFYICLGSSSSLVSDIVLSFAHFGCRLHLVATSLAATTADKITTYQLSDTLFLDFFSYKYVILSCDCSI